MLVLTCLQILLNYLPPDRRQWKGLLEQKRAAYQQFRQELIIDPKKQEQSAAADHPLSQSSDSRWNAYFKVSMGACIVRSLTLHLCKDPDQAGPAFCGAVCV